MILVNTSESQQHAQSDRQEDGQTKKLDTRNVYTIGLHNLCSGKKVVMVLQRIQHASTDTKHIVKILFAKQMSFCEHVVVGDD